MLAAHMSETILKELDFQVHETYFWSDSMTSLQYIKNETRRFQTFVRNGVSEIHETTSPKQWHHIPGVINPADEGSCGVSAGYFQADCRWWKGPKFLWQPEHTWPSVSMREVQDDDKELGKSSNVLLSTNMSQVDLLLQRLSSWPHLLLVMSWVLHFIKRCRRETHNAVPVMTPTLSEQQSASREVVRVVQRECFHEEYVALKGGEQVKSNSKLANLSPILVNDVIRVGRRIHRAPVAFEAARWRMMPYYSFTPATNLQ